MAVGKGPLDALREWWGRRSDLRGTYGDPDLTRAVALCHRLEEKFRIRGMKDLADQLIQGRSGEAGWGTDVDIRAVEAASEKAFIPRADAASNGKE